MKWDHLPDITAFDDARRREAYRRLARAARGQEADRLLELDDVRGRLALFEQRYVGIEPIPVARVVGTASRSRDFDRQFRPIDEGVRERWRRIEQAFPRGDFPPILVYRVGEAYFVVDGHHRVAVARHRGVDFIDAEVTELRSRIPLPADADLGRLIVLEHERTFMHDSGLERARPEARIECSRPQGYLQLLEQIHAHGFELSVEREAYVPPEEAAGHWYDQVFLPTVEVIQREGLPETFPDAPDGDLFLWVNDRRRGATADPGHRPIEETIRTARQELGARSGRRPRRPGGQRRRGSRERRTR